MGEWQRALASATQPVILIAGISGGIGSHVAFAARVAGLHAVSLSEWLQDGGQDTPRGPAVLGVVNCAGRGMSPISVETYDKLVAANVEVTRTCIRVALINEVPLVHLGSAMETVNGRTDPYVLTKRMAAELVSDAQSSKGHALRAVQLSLHNVYGPRLKGAVTDIVEQHLLSQPASLRQPAAVRDFVFVSDVAAAVLTALELGDYPARIPIGTGLGTSIADVAEIVSSFSGIRPPWTSARVVQDRETAFDLVADINVAKQALDWRTTVDLCQGAGAVFSVMASGMNARRFEES